MALEDDLNTLSGKLAATETILTGLLQDFLRRTADPHAAADDLIASWADSGALAGKPKAFVQAYKQQIEFTIRLAEKTLRP
jgi:hypothetical protein